MKLKCQENQKLSLIHYKDCCEKDASNKEYDKPKINYFCGLDTEKESSASSDADSIGYVSGNDDDSSNKQYSVAVSPKKTASDDTDKINYFATHDVVLSEEKQQAAAAAIQKCFRGYSIRQTNANLSKDKQLEIDMPIRRIVYGHIQTVVKIFHASLAAEYCNNNNDAAKISLLRYFLIKMRTNYEAGIISGYGNCDEMARTLYVLIQDDPHIPENVKDNMCLGQLEYPDDHIFVVIGGYIADPWLAFINLHPTQGYRPVMSYAKRKAGFLGKQDSYLRFLQYHEDGRYIVKGADHNIIRYDFPEEIQKVVRSELAQLAQREKVEKLI